MTQEQRRQILRALAKSTERDAKSPARARKTLIARGLLTPSGKLPKVYRMPKPEKPKEKS